MTVPLVPLFFEHGNDSYCKNNSKYTCLIIESECTSFSIWVMVIGTILFIYYQQRWQNGKRSFSTSITIATLKFFSCCFPFYSERAGVSTTLHSFVNDGSEGRQAGRHTHTSSSLSLYIYLNDKREKRQSSEKRVKKEKKR